MCGMETNALAVYINPSRGQIIVENGYIDTDNATNAFFLQRRIAKGKAEKPSIPNYNASPVYIPKLQSKEGEDLPSYEQSEQLVKFWDSKKREKEVEKLQIDIEKKRGVVVPSELIEPVILQHNQCIIASFENACDRILITFSKIKDFNAIEIAQMRGEIIAAINWGVDNATSLSLKEVANIVNDYSEKRGVGEKL